MAVSKVIARAAKTAGRRIKAQGSKKATKGMGGLKPIGSRVTPVQSRSAVIGKQPKKTYATRAQAQNAAKARVDKSAKGGFTGYQPKELGSTYKPKKVKGF